MFPTTLPIFAGRDELADLNLAASAIPNLPQASDIALVSIGGGNAIGRIEELTNDGMKVIALARRTQIAARLSAMAAGAFDVLTLSPVAPAELFARLQLAAHGSALPTGIALVATTLHLGATTYDLKPREAEIVNLLIAAQGHAVRHDRLLSLWGEHAHDRQYLRVAMRALRRRIEPEPDMPRYLLSEPALGYRMGNGMAVRPVPGT